MLAEASPTYKTAMTIIGLVINCLGTISHILPPLFHTCYIYFIVLYSKQQLYYLANLSHHSCKVVLFLVLGKVNVVCVELYRWSIELERIFVLPLAPHWVRHLLIKKGYKRSPTLVGYQDLFLAPLPGSNSVG